MGSLSIWHWAIILVLCGAIVPPYWKIFVRAGMPGGLSILMLVPIVSLILPWMLAYKRWPGDEVNK